LELGVQPGRVTGVRLEALAFAEDPAVHRPLAPGLEDGMEHHGRVQGVGREADVEGEGHGVDGGARRNGSGDVEAQQRAPDEAAQRDAGVEALARPTAVVREVVAGDFAMEDRIVGDRVQDHRGRSDGGRVSQQGQQSEQRERLPPQRSVLLSDPGPS
jgi:hypothetical protein